MKTGSVYKVNFLLCILLLKLKQNLKKLKNLTTDQVFLKRCPPCGGDRRCPKYRPLVARTTPRRAPRPRTLSPRVAWQRRTAPPADTPRLQV